VTDQQTTVAPGTAPPGGPGWGTRLVRGVGWTLIATGVVILLYLVYLLFFTNVQTDRAQGELLDAWELQIGTPDDALPAEDVDDATEAADPVDPGGAYAALWFERGGERIVHDDTLYVVEGVSVADLRRGPGHYPDTAEPGEVGNLGISGHRTTYGAPFYHLDRLQEGDRIHVVDRDNREWVYAFHERRIVQPTDTWVIGDDPLGTGGALLTLTTCHPRLSAAQRMIVFATLVGEPKGAAA
jgi:sortase A